MVVALLALMIGLAAFRPWPLDEPVIYRADVVQHLAMVQATDDLGRVSTSPTLGAPGPVDWSAFPTGSERLQLLMLRGIDAATGDVVVTMNLYLLLGLVVTAVVWFAVLRWMHVGPFVAGAASLVLTFSPTWGRAVFDGHLFLFATYPVALGFFLAFWGLDRSGRSPRVSRSSLCAALSAAVVVGLSDAYYATFTVLILAGVALLAAARRRDPRRLVAPFAVIAVIMLTMAASLAPELLDRHGQPTNTAAERTVADARRYGLRPADLLDFRADHPVGPLRSLADRLDDGRDPSPIVSTFGVAALVGLAWTIGVAARRWRRPRDGVDLTVIRLAAVAAVGLLFALSGGLGWVLAELGFTQIRAWSRMTVYVYGASIVGLVVLAQRSVLRRELEPLTRVALVGSVAALAMLDQGLVVPPRDLAASAADVDASVAATIRSQVGPDGSVFELPVVSFPDDPGSGRLLAPSLAGTHLRFSSGFFRGGSDDWQISWCRQPSDVLARAVAAMGFDAVLLQQDHHLVDRPREQVTSMSDVAGAPEGRSADSAWVWWNLSGLRRELVERYGGPAVARSGRIVARPVGVAYDGVVDYTTAGRTFDGSGAVLLRRLDDDTGALDVQVGVTAEPGSVVRVGGEQVVLDADGRGVARIRIDPLGEVTRIEVTSPAGGRVIVSGVSVLDERAFGDEVLRADPTFRTGRLGCT